MTDDQKTRATAAWLAAAAEPTRVRIIRHLASGESNVTDLATALGVEIVNVSHHLGVMRTGGVLQSRRDGRCILYSLGEGVVADATSVTVRGPAVSIRLDL